MSDVQVGKRSRHKNRDAQGTGKRLFHGGAPDLAVGEQLISATELGASYSYLDRTARYDPRFVYVTADENVARAYAGRYLDAAGREIPGAVYEVQPRGELIEDPDYTKFGEFRDTFFACRSVTVMRVIEQNVRLSIQQQLELERPYLVWGDPNKPIYDPDGFIIPSDQMTANGVTREWTTMLRPWLRVTDVDAKGRLACAGREPDPWVAMLDLVPSLDRVHTIRPVHQPGRWWNRSSATVVLECAECGQSFEELIRAAHHQLGERQMDLMAEIHGWPSPMTPTLADMAQERSPERWEWWPGTAQWLAQRSS